MPVKIDLSKNIQLREYDVHVDYINEYPFIGTITTPKGNFDVHQMERSKNTFVVLKQRPYKNVYRCVGQMRFSRSYFHGITTHHPEYTQIDSQYQGCGIAKEAYLLLCKEMIIRSGKCQSKGSMKLWYNLAKSKAAEVYTYYKDEWTPVDVCDDEQMCTLYERDIYEQNGVMVCVGVR